MLAYGFPHMNDGHESDYAPGQYPGYLTPDGTWCFGANAKSIADAAWANRNRPSAPKPRSLTTTSSATVGHTKATAYSPSRPSTIGIDASTGSASLQKAGGQNARL
jgi:hypothetical protein